MQYEDLKRRSDNPRRFDCASGHPEHPKCLNLQKEFEIAVNKFPGGDERHNRRIRSRDDIYKYLKYACRLLPEFNEIYHLLYANICPAPLITQLSVELYQMYQFCGTSRFPYPGGYLDQLEIYIQAAGIIASEESSLEKEALKRDGKR